MRDGAQAELVGNLQDEGPDHFVDAQAGDLHLVDGSHAIDAGDPSGLDHVELDFDQQPRDATPDVGADELP